MPGVSTAGLHGEEEGRTGTPVPLCGWEALNAALVGGGRQSSIGERGS